MTPTILIPLTTVLITAFATTPALANAETSGWITEVRAAPPASPRLNGPAHAVEGIASFYWQDQMTASGERFDKRAMTAAHRTLPFGTLVRVTNLSNGRSTVVRINDRGPFKPGRVIDVSEAAAEHLEMRQRGLVPVKLDVLDR